MLRALELLKTSCSFRVDIVITPPLVIGITVWILEQPFATYTQYLWHDYDKWDRENRYIGRRMGKLSRARVCVHQPDR